MIRRPPRSTLFPYTTALPIYTSCVAVSVDDELPSLVLDAGTGLQDLALEFGAQPFDGVILLTHLHWDHVQGRSEEHTSELQSRQYLVCRLLLEKKNQYTNSVM